MAAGPRSGWMALQSGGRAVELINEARTAAYLSNPALAPSGVDICSVLDMGGCANYDYMPCSGRGYVDLPGASGNYLSTPDAAALDITGDITLIAYMAPTDWSPASLDGIVTKWNTTGNQRSYALHLRSTGHVELRWSPDGTTEMLEYEEVLNPAAGGDTWQWVAATLDVDSGASNRTIRFFTSIDGVSWMKITEIVRSGVTSIFNSTAALMIGANSTGTTLNFEGNIGYISVRNGIGAAGVPGGTEVFRYDGSANLLNTTVNASSFTATTGQTITVNRSGAQQTTIVPVRYDYVSPSADNAPWYSSAHPASADALGFHIEEWTGLGDGHVKAQVRSVGSMGGIVGPLGSEGRVMKLNILMFARTEESMQYLFDWLSMTLIGVCGGCGDDKMLFRRFCGDVSNPMAGIGEMRRVRLTEGLTWESDPSEIARCWIRRASFTITAGDPCVYLPEYAPSVTTLTANLTNCFGATYIGATRYPCRPTCSELVATCRASYRFSSTPFGAMAPVVSLHNYATTPSFPMRLVLYSDPYNVGVTYGGCGLPILAEVYVRSLPPGSDFVWDVTGRAVWFHDVSTGGYVDGSGYIDANDPPVQRYAAMPCGDSMIVIEPGTLCLQWDGSSQWVDYNTGQGYAAPAYPTATVTLQERVGCP